MAKVLMTVGFLVCLAVGCTASYYVGYYQGIMDGGKSIYNDVKQNSQQYMPWIK